MGKPILETRLLDEKEAAEKRVADEKAMSVGKTLDFQDEKL